MNSVPAYLEPLAGFSPRKVAQISVYFALLQGNFIEKLKLIKLIYFADREFMRKYGDPMTWDEFYSLPHGPVCSASLNCINKIIYSEITDAYFLLNGNRVVPVRSFSYDEYDELSRAEFDVLTSIWARHGHRTASQLRNFSHAHCPEYTEIDRGRIPIAYEEVFAAVSHPEPDESADDLLSFRKAIAQYT